MSLWRSRAVPLRSTLRSVLRTPSRRAKSNLSSPDDLPHPQTHSVQEGFAQHPVFVFNVAKRFIKYSFVGLAIVGSTSAAVYEATHQWVENVELKRPQEGSQVHAWEWDLDSEKWGGDDKGGTDSGLGLHGRHMVRAAWMALNWGAGQSNATVIATDASSSSGDGLLGPSGLKFIDPRLVLAEACLHTAVDVAERKSAAGKLLPWTLSQILSLHASVLARMGSDSLPAAKEQYERAWASQPALTKDSARLALKLGDLSFRMGQSEAAMAWWGRGAYLVQDKPDSSLAADYPHSLIQHMPESPSAQRTLLSILSSTSAFFATAGKLKEARALDEASFGLIRSTRHPESISSVSAAHALHALTLLQRSSVCCIRLGEIYHALKERPAVSVQWLSTAAQSSERVALALTGIPSGVISTIITHQNSLPSPKDTLLPSYTESPSMHQPAKRLLRDARRTAAESWNLIGILSEKKDPKFALDCFKRAVVWASKADSFGEPGDETLAADWDVIWGNYSRLVGITGRALD